MKLKKLVGTILTGALLMTSGITAFAAVPDETIIIHAGGSFGTDLAYSVDYLDTEVGASWKENIDNLPETCVYFKQNGQIKSLKDNKILPNKDLKRTIYFDVKKVMEIENYLDVIMNNEVYSHDFVETNEMHLSPSIYPTIPMELLNKYRNNGIVGDCVLNISASGKTNLVDSEKGMLVKRSDYPRIMNYYYTEVYEDGDGNKIK